jgi:hypothetical protein
MSFPDCLHLEAAQPPMNAPAEAHWNYLPIRVWPLATVLDNFG